MKYLITCSLAFIILSCSPKPEPLSYNHDACHFCKMTLTDKKYGAEIVTQKNKIYKFDDINCMIHFLENGEVDHHEIAYQLVTDYSNPDRGLINAADAFYLLSDQLRSPMASEVAAFEKQDSMSTMKRKVGGIYLAWGELKTQFK